MDPAAQEQFGAALLAALQPDDATRRRAEEFIRERSTHPVVVALLVHHLKHSPHEGVRQLAAILLRRRVNKFWSRVGQAAQAALKQTLLESLYSDVRVVKRCVAMPVAAIAKHQLPMGQWPELSEFLWQAARSDDSTHKEMAYYVFHVLTGMAQAALEPHYDKLIALYTHGMSDASPAVRVAAAKASGELLELLADDEGERLMAGAGLVPAMLAVAHQCLETGDEDTPIFVFDVVANLSASSQPVLKAVMPDLVRFLLHVAAKESLEMNTRESACSALSRIIMFRPKSLARGGLVPTLVDILLHILSQESEEEEEEVFNPNDDSPTAHHAAQTCLEYAVTHLPNKRVAAPTLDAIWRFMSSSNPRERQAGVLALGVVSQGLLDDVRQRMPVLMPAVLAATADPSPLVREKAGFCLGLWGQHLATMLDYSADVLPAVLRLLDDPLLRVQQAGCHVLDAYCDKLVPEQMLPFADDIMGRLARLLHSEQLFVQEMVVSAVAATALAFEERFAAYFPKFMPAIQAMMNATDPRHMVLRGRATECAGQLAVAVGKDTYRPFLDVVMHSATEGLQLDDYDLKDMTCALYANLLAVFKDEFAPLVPQLVEFLLGLIAQRDQVDSRFVTGGQLVPGLASSDEEGGEEEAGEGGSDSDAELRDNVEPGSRVRYSLATPLAVCKEGATQALAAIAEHCPHAFLPHLPACLVQVSKLLAHPNVDIRRQAVPTMQMFVLSVAQVYPSSFTPGMPPAAPLPEKVQRVCDEVLDSLVTQMDADSDKEVVARCCDAINAVCKKLGPAAVAKVWEELCGISILLLRKETTCQADESDDEGDEAEHDDILMDEAAEVVCSLARVAGHSFAASFAPMADVLLSMCAPTMPWKSRSMALGCFAEVFEALGPGTAAYAPGLAPIAVRCVAEQQYNVRRNASYCAGMLCTHAPAEMLPHLPAVVGALQTALVRQPTDDDNAAVDNAVAALARIVAVSTDHVPVEAMVRSILPCLPTQSDVLENATCFNALLGLLLRAHPAAAPVAPGIVAACSRALAPAAGLPEQVKANIVEALRSLSSQYPDQMQALVRSMPPADQAVLSMALGGSA